MRRRRRDTLVKAAITLVVIVVAFVCYQQVIAPTGGLGVGCYDAATDPIELPGLYQAPESGTRLKGTACANPHVVEMIGYIETEGDRSACRAMAERFLGGPLDAARIVTMLPHNGAESEGLYPCAVAESGDTDGDVVKRTGSLRDTLRSTGGPLAITCMAHNGGDTWTYTACTAPHSAELLGVVADGGQPETSCRAAAESYIGKEFNARTDLELLWIAVPEHVACFATDKQDDNTLHTSIKSLGSAPLPRAR
jgi:hypothetical protein